MQGYFESSVENHFYKYAGSPNISTKVPYLLTDNFPKLGLLTALRFLEWASNNPEGVISLPTGKTPEHFIKWTKYILEYWDTDKVREVRFSNGLELEERPDLSGLHFVQIDEFYPIDPRQKNSFYSYVNQYYIDGFGLDPDKAILINADQIELADGLPFETVFPNYKVDLSLRYREPDTELERLQQESIFKIDNWCTNYEKQIRAKGGIGFFLGGIGPDGHIAFNTRGSDHNSTTRLCCTNFETQAASAGDLGGIEVSRDRLVITIGLETITYNPDAVAIIFAAGEAKAPVVKAALENVANVKYPATALQTLTNARFYLTKGAAVCLEDRIENYYSDGNWSFEKTERAVIDLCMKLGKYARRLSLEDLQADPFASRIPGLSRQTVASVIYSIKEKIEKGLKDEQDQVILHTGPHHDDIMLGLFPVVNRQLNESSNAAYFSVLTSGFTAVTNSMVIELLEQSLGLIQRGKISMLRYPDFYQEGYKKKWDKDVSNYLDKIADADEQGKIRGICHRLVRAVISIYGVKDTEELCRTIETMIVQLRSNYDGQKNTPDIQQFKGMIREFEEELVWAHYGVRVKDVEHLRLGFYNGNIFTELPERSRDVEPILNLLRRINPTLLSLAFDPEGAGPDTHYKVLQAIAEAIRQWGKEKDLSTLRIVGYRNVWHTFQLHEANVFTPVTLNMMAVMQQSFNDCYISQVNASFPSPYHDGPFSEMSQKVWVEQFKKVQLVLGKDFFYGHEEAVFRSAHGMVFHREMGVDEFLNHARVLEQSVEGIL
jgi:glucosamine-6-phosphate deaminase